MGSGPKESNGVEHLHTLAVPTREGRSVEASFSSEERGKGRRGGRKRRGERESLSSLRKCRGSHAVPGQRKQERFLNLSLFGMLIILH